MQSNRGYTPNELFDLLPCEEQMPQTLSFGPNIKKALAEGNMNAEELRRWIMEADLPSEGTGRGIPCKAGGREEAEDRQE